MAAAAGMIAVTGVVVALVVSSGGDGGGDDERVAVLELFEWGIAGDLEMSAGPVRLAATNTGAIPHNVGLRGGRISNEVAAGGAVELDLGDLAPGSYELYCDIVGHEEAGMVAAFTVTDPEGS